MYINLTMLEQLKTRAPRSHQYLMGQFQTFALSEDVVKVYVELIEAPEDEVRRMLSWGTLPEILIVPHLIDAGRAVQHSRAKGYRDVSSPEFTFGLFSESFFPGKIMIDASLVDAHERGEGWELSPARGLISLLGATILHELAHWLHYQIWGPGELMEMGQALEFVLYGHPGLVASDERSPWLLRWTKRERERERWQ